MKPSPKQYDPKKLYAAQNAKDGLINVADLSLLLGIPVTELTSFAKMGLLNHYGEYHGKRFYNFEEVVNWAVDIDSDDRAKSTIRIGLESTLRSKGCPYSLEKISERSENPTRVKVIWKEEVINTFSQVGV
ncbi:MAG: hypothetical protein KCHDKBKB_00523 [Elusimicrobia bacterium]|nr:hypothetical protein [Elusimicrobiota bacterium]